MFRTALYAPKVIEESPSPALTTNCDREMGGRGKIGQTIQYVNAGTEVEFYWTKTANCTEMNMVF
ncbi:MAG: hypothetical protein IPL78_32875 [Chloroflexi bacterium]|nr:hypothetical protein [Chloroflexota bacterium]